MVVVIQKSLSDIYGVTIDKDAVASEQAIHLNAILFSSMVSIEVLVVGGHVEGEEEGSHGEEFVISEFLRCRGGEAIGGEVVGIMVVGHVSFGDGDKVLEVGSKHDDDGNDEGG